MARGRVSGAFTSSFWNAMQMAEGRRNRASSERLSRDQMALQKEGLDFRKKQHDDAERAKWDAREEADMLKELEVFKAGSGGQDDPKSMAAGTEALKRSGYGTANPFGTAGGEHAAVRAGREKARSESAFGIDPNRFRVLDPRAGGASLFSKKERSQDMRDVLRLNNAMVASGARQEGREAPVPMNVESALDSIYEGDVAPPRQPKKSARAMGAEAEKTLGSETVDEEIASYEAIGTPAAMQKAAQLRAKKAPAIRQAPMQAGFGERPQASPFGIRSLEITPTESELDAEDAMAAEGARADILGRSFDASPSPVTVATDETGAKRLEGDVFADDEVNFEGDKAFQKRTEVAGDALRVEAQKPEPAPRDDIEMELERHLRMDPQSTNEALQGKLAMLDAYERNTFNQILADLRADGEDVSPQVALFALNEFMKPTADHDMGRYGAVDLEGDSKKKVQEAEALRRVAPPRGRQPPDPKAMRIAAIQIAMDRNVATPAMVSEYNKLVADADYDPRIVANVIRSLRDGAPLSVRNEIGGARPKMAGVDKDADVEIGILRDKAKEAEKSLRRQIEKEIESYNKALMSDSFAGPSKGSIRKSIAEANARLEEGLKKISTDLEAGIIRVRSGRDKTKGGIEGRTSDVAEVFDLEKENQNDPVYVDLNRISPEMGKAYLRYYNKLVQDGKSREEAQRGARKMAESLKNAPRLGTSQGSAPPLVPRRKVPGKDVPPSDR